MGTLYTNRFNSYMILPIHERKALMSLTKAICISFRMRIHPGTTTWVGFCSHKQNSQVEVPWQLGHMCLSKQTHVGLDSQLNCRKTKRKMVKSPQRVHLSICIILCMSIMTNKNCPFSEIRCCVVHMMDAAPIWVF
jgi:hypothetical protein